jgi:hypothetical protein
MSTLKDLARLLREAEGEEKKPELEKGEDSLDTQVDKFLSSYEEEAKNSKNEGFNYGMIARRFIFEADEDKEDDKAPEEKTEKLTGDDLNMQSFVTDVMRLVDNYDNLLEIRNTLLRRAANRLAKNYEPDVLAAFKEVLLESYGVEIGQSESEKADEYQAPKAGAAGPMGGGGAA